MIHSKGWGYTLANPPFLNLLLLFTSVKIRDNPRQLFCLFFEFVGRARWLNVLMMSMMNIPCFPGVEWSVESLGVRRDASWSSSSLAKKVALDFFPRPFMEALQVQRGYWKRLGDWWAEVWAEVLAEVWEVWVFGIYLVFGILEFCLKLCPVVVVVVSSCEHRVAWIGQSNPVSVTLHAFGAARIYICQRHCFLELPEAL